MIENIPNTKKYWQDKVLNMLIVPEFIKKEIDFVEKYLSSSEVFVIADENGYIIYKNLLANKLFSTNKVEDIFNIVDDETNLTNIDKYSLFRQKKRAYSTNVIVRNENNITELAVNIFINTDNYIVMKGHVVNNSTDNSNNPWYKPLEDIGLIPFEYDYYLEKYCYIGKNYKEILHIDRDILTNRHDGFETYISDKDVIRFKEWKQTVLSGINVPINLRLYYNSSEIKLKLCAYLYTDGGTNQKRMRGGIINISHDSKMHINTTEYHNVLNSFLKNSSLGIIIFDNELRVETLNKRAVEIIGKSEKDLIGVSIENLSGGKNKDKRIKQYKQVLKTGQSIEFEDEIHYNSNFKKNVYVSVFKINTGIVIVGLDVTKMRQLENKVLLQDRILTEVQKISDLGHWTWDLVNKELVWSENTYKIFDINKEEFIIDVNSYFNMVHPEDVQFLQGVIEKSIAEKKAYKIEHRIVTPKGKIKYIIGSGTTILDKNNEIIKLLGGIQDITKIKQAQQSIIATNKINQKILSSINEAVVLVNSKGNVIDCNQNFENIFSVHKTNIIGKSERILFQIISKEIINPEEFLSKISGVLQMPEIEVFELVYLKNKKVIEYYHKVLIANGEISNILWIFDDITEWKRANDKLVWYSTDLEMLTTDLENKKYELEETVTQLDMARKKAESATEAKSKFLANMSHEIRTPMNAIIGFTEILKDQYSHLNNNKYLDSISTASNNLLDLINDILDLSKIEAGKIDLKPEYINLHGLIQEVIDMFMYTAGEKGIELHLHYDKAIADSLYLDIIRLRQILVNIIGNAVKFTEIGSIYINVNLMYCIDIHQSIKIEIIDTGIGIKKENIELIFEEFTQQESSNSKKYGGTGLGLAITKKLANLMQAKLSVDSEINKGSTFSLEIFNIPSKVAENIEVDNKVANNLYVFEKLKLLIFENVLFSSEIIREYYHNIGVEVTIAKDIDSADILMSDLTPDIVITNSKIPIPSLEEFMINIRKNHKYHNTKILMITNVPKEMIELRIADMIDGYIITPIIFDTLNKLLFTLVPEKVKEQDINIPNTSSEIIFDDYIEENVLAKFLPMLKTQLKYFTLSELDEMINNMLSVAKFNNYLKFELYLISMQVSLNNFDIDDLNKKMLNLYKSIKMIVNKDK